MWSVCQSFRLSRYVCCCFPVYCFFHTFFSFFANYFYILCAILNILLIYICFTEIWFCSPAEINAVQDESGQPKVGASGISPEEPASALLLLRVALISQISKSAWGYIRWSCGFCPIQRRKCSQALDLSKTFSKNCCWLSSSNVPVCTGQEDYTSKNLTTEAQKMLRPYIVVLM